MQRCSSTVRTQTTNCITAPPRSHFSIAYIVTNYPNIHILHNGMTGQPKIVSTVFWYMACVRGILTIHNQKEYQHDRKKTWFGEKRKH